MSERDLDRVWCRARPRLNAACDKDVFEPPLWLVGVTTALWCFVLNWLWVTFVAD